MILLALAAAAQVPPENCKIDGNPVVCATLDPILWERCETVLCFAKQRIALDAARQKYWEPIPAKEPDIRPVVKRLDYVICYGQSSTICATAGRTK